MSTASLQNVVEEIEAFLQEMSAWSLAHSAAAGESELSMGDMSRQPRDRRSTTDIIRRYSPARASRASVSARASRASVSELDVGSAQLSLIEETDGKVMALLLHIEQLDVALDAAQASGDNTEQAQKIILEMINAGVEVAARSLSTKNATNAGALLASLLQTSKRFGDIHPLVKERVETAAANVFMRVLSPAWTANSTAVNNLTQTNDLMSLPRLELTTLRDTIRMRYNQGVPYTYAGDVVVSVNPCRNMGNMGDEILRAYRHGNRNRMPPHLFRLADDVLTQVRAPASSRIARELRPAGPPESSRTHLTYNCIRLCSHLSRFATAIAVSHLSHLKHAPSGAGLQQ